MADVEIEGIGVTYAGGAGVRDVSFVACGGRVTAMLGPNGAGKSTVLRVMLGLQRGTGTARFAGHPYRDLPDGSRVVGVMLDASAVHPGHTARTHLEWLCAGRGIVHGRVATLLRTVGLADVADRRVRTFSLGMRQRLGLAGALVGDPEVLILDEPGNGLDPEGMHWLRRFLDRFAADGGCVLVASHQLHDLEEIVDDVVVMSQGRVVTRSTIADFLAASGTEVLVRGDSLDSLAAALVRAGAVIDAEHARLRVRGVTPMVIGRAARDAGAALYELTPRRVSLEQAYLQSVAAADARVADADVAQRPGDRKMAEARR